MTGCAQKVLIGIGFMKNRTVLRYSEYNPHKVSLTVALSTTAKRLTSFEQQLLDLKDQTRHDFELLVLIQACSEAEVERLDDVVRRNDVPFRVSVLWSLSVGLLLSRNLALENASASLVLLADDDCRYFCDSVENVIQEADRFKSSEILTFQAQNADGELLNPKNAPTAPDFHNKYSVMSVCSIEVVIRRSLVKRIPELFDERFGLGTPFNTGGENIMLLDNLRRGVCMTRHPLVIVSHPVLSSGIGKNGLGPLAFAKGAMFQRMFGLKGVLVLLVFFLRCMVRNEPGFRLRHLKAAIDGYRKAPRPTVNKE